MKTQVQSSRKELTDLDWTFQLWHSSVLFSLDKDPTGQETSRERNMQEQNVHSWERGDTRKQTVLKGSSSFSQPDPTPQAPTQRKQTVNNKATCLSAGRGVGVGWGGDSASQKPSFCPGRLVEKHWKSGGRWFDFLAWLWCNYNAIKQRGQNTLRGKQKERVLSSSSVPFCNSRTATNTWSILQNVLLVDFQD